MFADVNYAHPAVREETKKWALWVAKELNLTGLRFDAVRHISESFTKELINHLDENTNKNWFHVGEWWQDSAENMNGYLDKMERKFSLFDAPLFYNFAQLSTVERGDLRSVFDGTLIKTNPIHAVTVVGNHDTQVGQASFVKIEGWIKPLAYAIILLRVDGYPCVFYGVCYRTRLDAFSFKDANEVFARGRISSASRTQITQRSLLVEESYLLC